MVTVMPVPWILQKYGVTLRGRSHFLLEPTTQRNQAVMASVDTFIAQECDQDQQRECIIKQRHLNQPSYEAHVSASFSATCDNDLTGMNKNRETKYLFVTDMGKIQR